MATKKWDEIRGGASTASWAVRDLNRAMGELEKTGQVTDKTLSAIVGLLIRINPAAGAVAEAIFLVYQQFENVKKVELADSVSAVTDQFKLLNVQFEQHVATASAGVGKYEELKSSYENIARAQQNIVQIQHEWRDAEAKLAQAIKDNQITEAGAQAAQKAFLADEESAIDFWNRYINDIERGLPVKRFDAELSHTQTTRLNELELAAEQAAISGSRLIAHWEARKRLAIDQNQDEISHLLERMKLEEQARILESEAGRELYEQQVKDLVALERTNEKLKIQDELLNNLGNIADSAIGQLGTGAFDAYAAAMDKTISLNNVFSESTGRALENVASATVKSIGEQCAAKGAMALADSLVALALGDTYTAGLDAEAAGIYFAIAAAAGVGAGALSVNPKSPGGSGRSHHAGGGGGNSGDTINQYVTVIGTLDDAGAQDLAQQLARAREQRDLSQ